MLDLSRAEIETLIEPDRVVQAIEAGYKAATDGSGSETKTAPGPAQ